MSNIIFAFLLQCRLPEVKKFLNEDLEAKYVNTQFKKVPGKAPVMKFFDEVKKQIFLKGTSFDLGFFPCTIMCAAVG